MMYRVYGNKDAVYIHAELHLPAAGFSIGVPDSLGTCNAQGRDIFWKLDKKIEMGPTRNNPMGLGHDGGPGRIHLLVCPGGPGPSAVASLFNTATSGVKPHYTAHKVQINAGGSLPICCQKTPDREDCMFSLLFCGTPSSPNTDCPVSPDHTALWVGMTKGDIAGGNVNMLADQLWDIATFGIGEKLKTCGKIGKIIADWALPIGLRFLGAINFSTGPNNPGGAVQQQMDGDGVTSDAGSSFAVFGFGVGTHGGSSSADPSSSGLGMITPWSP